LEISVGFFITGARMAKRPSQPRPRTFVYRGGTRVAGSVLACDASSGGDLLFLSNALGHLGGGEARPRARAPRAPAPG